jgi:uncharacterized membrane protein YfcA
LKKILSLFIETVFWVQLFITPLGIGALIAIFIYISNEKLLWLSIVIMAISAIIGVWYAERVRRKHGTSRYASRIIATPDIWPDEYPEEIEERERSEK